jgi:hypothetical protein
MLNKTKEDYENLPKYLKRVLDVICLWENAALHFTESCLDTYTWGRLPPGDAERCLKELCELGWLTEFELPREWFSYTTQQYVLSETARPYLSTIWRTVRR